MEIKPTGPEGNFPSVSNENQQVTNKPFTGTAAASDAAMNAAATQTNPALSSALAEYKKSDLQDPAKVEQMLSHCTSGLLSDAVGQSNTKLSPEESSNLSGWMQNDPTIRGKLLSYLDKVLK